MGTGEESSSCYGNKVGKLRHRVGSCFKVGCNRVCSVAGSFVSKPSFAGENTNVERPAGASLREGWWPLPRRVSQGTWWVAAEGHKADIMGMFATAG